ncbi:MAG: hypothetical protein ACRYG2_02750, partial [Janthinobacterium lividum]
MVVRPRTPHPSHARHCNTFTQTVDEVHYGVMEGPRLQAQTALSEVRSAEIGAAERRWPRFTRKAAEVG